MSTTRESSNMHIFWDIKIVNEYSKYLKDLNRIHSQSGVKTFIHSLKNQKVFFEEDDLLSSVKKKEKPREEFNAALYEKMLKRIKEKVITKPYIKIPINIRTIKNLEKRRKNQLEENRELSFAKYRPNYNSIRKKIPIIDFTKMPKRTIFSSLISPQNSSRDSVLINQQKGENSIEDNGRIPNLPYSFSSDSLYNKKEINHALRFSKYTWRKEIRPKYSPCESMREHLSFISNNNTKGCFEFNKMKTNSHLPLSKTTNGPTIGMYNPNYNSIFQKTPKVTFCLPKKKQHNKQYLIQKIWKNYEVVNQYQLVDLDSKA